MIFFNISIVFNYQEFSGENFTKNFFLVFFFKCFLIILPNFTHMIFMIELKFYEIMINTEFRFLKSFEKIIRV